MWCAIRTSCATWGGREVRVIPRARLEDLPMTSMQNEKPDSESIRTREAFVVGFWGVRYQVRDVQRAIAFYTQTLGFNLDQQHLPAFGQVSIGDLKLILSGPGTSGARPMPDGR